MRKRDGRSALISAATILLIVAAANVAYVLYRVSGGHGLELPLITGAVFAAGLAAILFGRAKAGPRD